MGARVTMRPQTLTSEMLLLIEAQADGAEVFTLPGDVTAQLARLARRALAEAAGEKPGHQAGKRMAEARTELQEKADGMVRFLSAEQRLALRMALHNAVQ